MRRFLHATGRPPNSDHVPVRGLARCLPSWIAVCRGPPIGSTGRAASCRIRGRGVSCRQQYAFVDELAELRPLIRGAGHLERFDYWLANFKYLRALGKVNCTWAELNAALDAMKQRPDAASRKDIAVRKALPLRVRLIRELTYVQQYPARHGQHARGNGDRGQLATARLPAVAGSVGESDHARPPASR